MTSPVLGSLTDSVTKAQGAMQSAEVLIGGFNQKLVDAIAAALANGANEQELVPVQALSDALSVEADKLAAAVAANP